MTRIGVGKETIGKRNGEPAAHSSLLGGSGRGQPVPCLRFGPFVFPIWLILLAIIFSWAGASVAGADQASAPANSPAIDSADRDFWNGKFSDSQTLFNRQPSRFLVEAIRDRKPGSALDLGMGEGRNAIYLAQQGWQVTGVDESDVAVSQAKAHASKAGVKLAAVVDGLDHYDFGRNRWELIILFYMHSWYHGAKPQSANRIQAALKPGGWLVIEGFAGPENYQFQPNELLHDFGELRILRYEDVQAEADWAPGGKSHIIRLVAEKHE